MSTKPISGRRENVFPLSTLSRSGSQLSVAPVGFFEPPALYALIQGEWPIEAPQQNRSELGAGLFL
ncbi:MAG: hypothetical protein AAF657_18450 [Acidobacteriota bacterium]